MRIVELRTGLFPDAGTVAAALAGMERQHSVALIDVSLSELGDEAWDAALAAILAADLVVVA